MFITEEMSFHTVKQFDIINITDQVKKFVEKNKFKNGLLNVFSRHTTATIKINEAEDGFRSDMQARCDKYVPEDNFYQHNDLENRDPKTMYQTQEESLDGHSHIRTMLFGVSSETIPIKDGQMLLGMRQSILLIEMDHERERKIIFSFTGE